MDQYCEYLQKRAFLSCSCLYAADAGDFTMNKQNLVFAQGDTTDCILFDFVNDNKVEGNEWFTITAGTAIATIVIADNDGVFGMKWL